LNRFFPAYRAGRRYKDFARAFGFAVRFWTEHSR
jgi:hypothetical protein